MKPRWAPEGSNIGSTLSQQESPKAPWRPLGGPWAASKIDPRRGQNGVLEVSDLAPEILGPSWASRAEARGGAPGGYFARYFSRSAPGAGKINIFGHLYLHLCVYVWFRVLSFVAFPVARPAPARTLKKQVFAWSVCRFSHFGFFRARPKTQKTI